LWQASGAVRHGAAWQRCRGHFLRNALALVSKGAQQPVAATIRTVFVQPTAEAARRRWPQVADGFRERRPRPAELMGGAETGVQAYLGYPPAHWRQLWSTNPLERLNTEVRRSTDAVGIFPNGDAAVRLVGALLVEQHDEWQVGRTYFSAESLAPLRAADGPPLALAADSPPPGGAAVPPGGEDDAIYTPDGTLGPKVASGLCRPGRVAPCLAA
jgi:transposase-like protein